MLAHLQLLLSHLFQKDHNSSKAFPYVTMYLLLVLLCAADGKPAAPAQPQASTSALASDELEGLFTTAQPGAQAAQPQLQQPGPQPWQQSAGLAQPGQGMQGMNPALAMMMMQAGMGMGMQHGTNLPPGRSRHLQPFHACVWSCTEQCGLLHATRRSHELPSRSATAPTTLLHFQWLLQRAV